MRGNLNAATAAVCALFLMSCASRDAPDFKKRWTPVNRFAETSEAIPLRPAHEFYATPLDGTLKNLLGRWAKDSGRELTYAHPSDYTLYAPVARIHTADLTRAIAELSAAYADRGLEIAVEPKRILVSDRGQRTADQRTTESQ